MSKREQLIEQLFKLGGLDEEVSGWMTYSFAILRQKYPTLTNQQLITVRDKYGPGYYLSKLRFVYSQHFSDTELEQITKFWASEAGRKLIRGSFFEAQKQLASNWAREVEEICRHVVKGEENGNGHSAVV